MVNQTTVNVLITLYTTSWGGAEESVLNLANEANKRGVKAIVLWISSYSDKKALPTSKSVKVFHLVISPVVYPYLAGIIVSFLCIWYRINVVNLNWRFVNQESRFLKLLGIKSLATIRAIFLDRDTCKEFDRTDMVVGVSNAVTERVKEIGYTKPCITIYNGIDTKRLRLFNKKKFSPNKILSMSRLVGWKRIDWTIKAVHELHKKGVPVTLDIYGEGKEQKNLNNLIRKLKSSSYISLKGYVNNNHPCLSEYGIFTLPSFCEPFGKVVVENVIRGRVIVGSRSGGIPELLTNYDLLFEHTNFNDYVSKLETAYQRYSEYSRKIAKYRDYFENKYNIGRVAQDYIGVYQQLIA